MDEYPGMVTCALLAVEILAVLAENGLCPSEATGLDVGVDEDEFGVASCTVSGDFVSSGGTRLNLAFTVSN